MPSLSQETITSTDLLDQVLVALTIKKALNGNEEAIEKLYTLYEGAAEALAVKFAAKFGIKEKTSNIKAMPEYS